MTLKKIPHLFPSTPQFAWQAVVIMAEECRMMPYKLCREAGVESSTVYKWRTNRRTYDVSIYAKILTAYERLKSGN